MAFASKRGLGWHLMSPAAKSAKRGPYAKSKQRRESIVAAAHEIFCGPRLPGRAQQDVAGKVGLSQTGLLHYFPSKSELLTAVLHWRDRNTGSGDAPYPEETLVDAVIRQARFNETVPGVIELYTVLCAESVTENHPGLDYFTERYDRLRRSYTGKFSALADEGRPREGVDPAQAAASLIALWDGLQTQ